jgi:hypothetical protein
MSTVKKDSTDVTRYIMLRDSADGTPETAYVIANLDLQYTRNRAAPAAKVDATALATTSTAHTDNYAIEVDSTSSPGLYRVDWPDAAFATGVDKVLLVVSGAGLDPAVEEIELVDYDPGDGVALGLSNLDVAISTRLAPTVAARTLDVTAAGEAGIDPGRSWLPTLRPPVLMVRATGTRQPHSTRLECERRWDWRLRTWIHRSLPCQLRLRLSTNGKRNPRLIPQASTSTSKR